MSWGHIIVGAIALIGAGLAAAAVIAILTYNKIIEWLEDRSQILEADRDRIGVSIIEHKSNGNYNTVIGIFDTETEEFIETTAIESKKIDKQIAEMHRETGYVIYTVSN